MSEEMHVPERGDPKRSAVDNKAYLVVCLLSAILFISFGVGFLVLPATHQERAHTSLSDNIAHALGHHVHGPQNFGPATPDSIPTYVVWDEATIQEALHGDPVQGEFIALNCTACHGDKGVSSQKWIPSLAGVNRIVLYKELADFRSGTRLSGPMTAIAQALTLNQSADVAAYFSSLSGGIVSDPIHAPGSGRSLRAKDPTLRLIYAGDPKRGLTGCASCHGPGAYRMGVPSLLGQNADYIEQQLQSFAQGVRRNDMNKPMRTVAGMLTADEMHALAQDFSVGSPLVK
jgi:cytochrome c553